MKNTYGGTEIDIGHSGWIFDDWRPTPIFHRVKFVGEPGEKYLVTGCGQPVHAERRGGLASATHLRAEHVVKFARPCLTCWPELRRQTSLFGRRRPALERTVQETLV